jgi:hypothetical protein
MEKEKMMYVCFAIAGWMILAALIVLFLMGATGRMYHD